MCKYLSGLREASLIRSSSHPSSPNYGKHWTSEQVTKAFAPSEETINTVKDWLVSSGVATERIAHSDNRGWLAFDATAEQAENLLQTKFYQYEDTETGHTVPACES